MKILKQSTAVTIKLGPFLDATDGVTAETGLTISQSDVILFKNFGAGAQKNDTNAATHDTGGWYGVPLNTTDTGTLGPLQIHVNESGALPVFEHYTVVPANVYDSIVAGSDKLQVDADEIDGSTSAATYLAGTQNLCEIDTVTNAGFAPTTTEFEVTTLATATADHWIGRRVYFTSGTLAKQGAKITDYVLNGGRAHFTVETLTSAPANGVTIIIV
jgi:hypothetical protein